MADRFNTAAGWVLFSGIVVLGLSAVSSGYFKADKVHVAKEEGGEGASGGKPAVAIETLLASADLAKGEAASKKCAACHTFNQGGANGIGPNLYAVMGEAIAAGRGGFAFSDALKGKGGKWDWTSMDAWLTSPSTFAPGTKKSFAGISDPQERANVIAYLVANGGGPAFPAPAAPAAEEAAPEGDAAAAEGDAAAAPAEGEAEAAPAA